MPWKNAFPPLNSRLFYTDQVGPKVRRNTLLRHVTSSGIRSGVMHATVACVPARAKPPNEGGYRRALILWVGTKGLCAQAHTWFMICTEQDTECGIQAALMCKQRD